MSDAGRSRKRARERTTEFAAVQPPYRGEFDGFDPLAAAIDERICEGEAAEAARRARQLLADRLTKQQVVELAGYVNDISAEIAHDAFTRADDGRELIFVDDESADELTTDSIARGLMLFWKAHEADARAAKEGPSADQHGFLLQEALAVLALIHIARIPEWAAGCAHVGDAPHFVREVVDANVALAYAEAIRYQWKLDEALPDASSPTTVYRANGATGGRGRASKMQPARELCRQLYREKPVDEKRSHFAHRIAPLIIKAERERINGWPYFTITGLPNTIGKWLVEDFGPISE